ncbi:riboflavin biosynthesis protein RibA [Legionella geestiana]|uniref:Riboflavin biosynthesis protein RibBA n=1 Tax=Legionella geestiana TaxID=45065 RepID=A0A0W0TR37_9GAMM|nr:bifunctional 3,4-dihydroxy-2-butanone-4-phosphate synthase/GTP cyclohydrolase II [Legionella geestiana]KTC97914.1 riboflavin biosynthesis protein RibA [Legionella geestiana]QBS11771.1 bifunctional 3,4-dihydroxy-2-butanone-4-phosphate synthase/GTP cyclohydrolase II [Legionella geestiana]QDQ40616.1 bifunctional 3,4-dihydroxy-2-butanone-4-phosphate synthase/GTP cyclohydrolase II [Legionella geestiana]STX53537.1 Riboflavin biosynthesis protein [Legionella geestiana]
MKKNPFMAVETALETLRAGNMVILVDDENRENEGDLVIAADRVTPEAITFMARKACGLICLSMAPEMTDRLGLTMMASRNRSPYGTAFTVSIEAASGVSTGISAADRARTVQVAVDPASTHLDLISPGHIFPLRACARGVFERQGQTEGSVDLARLAGLTPAAVICEIMNEDGSMSRFEQLMQFSKKHKIPLVSVRDVADYRVRHETLIEAVASVHMPLARHGDFTMTLFANQIDNAEHFVLTRPTVNADEPPLVRIHSECLTGDMLGSSRCDCGAQLEQSLERINREGGALIYLRQEGRGIGLANKLKAYALQEKGLDTVDANLHLGLPVDNREYAIAYQILKHLGIDTLRLITNNPKKVEALEHFGLKVSKRVSLPVHLTPENSGYLKTKQQKMGHLLALEPKP